MFIKLYQQVAFARSEWRSSDIISDKKLLIRR